MVLTFILSALVGSWSDALLHTTFVALAIFLLVEIVALTVPFIPFARPYESGHAKLKTRWPLYAIGVYLFAYALVRVERDYRSDSTSFGVLLLSFVVMIAALDAIGEIKARHRTTEPLQEFDIDEGRIAVLDLVGGVHRAHAES